MLDATLSSTSMAVHGFTHLHACLNILEHLSKGRLPSHLFLSACKFKEHTVPNCCDHVVRRVDTGAQHGPELCISAKGSPRKNTRVYLSGPVLGYRSRADGWTDPKMERDHSPQPGFRVQLIRCPKTLSMAGMPNRGWPKRSFFGKTSLWVLCHITPQKAKLLALVSCTQFSGTPFRLPKAKKGHWAAA